MFDPLQVRRPIGVTFAQATEANAERLSRIVVDCLVKVNTRDYDDKDIGKMIPEFRPDTIKDKIINPGTIIALRGAKIVGTGTLEGEYIRTVFVDPSYIRRGIGRQIMGELEKTAKANGCEKVSLNSSLTARDFYISLLYTEKSRERREVGGISIKMEKYL